MVFVVVCRHTNSHMTPYDFLSRKREAKNVKGARQGIITPRGTAADKMLPRRLQANRQCVCVVAVPVKDLTADLITYKGVTFHGFIKSKNCGACKKRKRDEGRKTKNDDAGSAGATAPTGAATSPPAAAAPSPPAAASQVTASAGAVTSVWLDRPPPSTVASTVHDKKNGGYAVLTNIITANDATTLLAMQPADDKSWGGLFGKKVFGKEDNAYAKSCSTSRRYTKELDKNECVVAAVVERVRTMLIEHGVMNDKHFVDAISLLLSLPGAPKQQYHLDFKDWKGTPGAKLFKRRKRDDDGTLPYPLSVLIALEAGSSWMVRRTGEEEKQIFISRLGAVVFRGDLTHAGSKYNERNVRFHIYFGVKHPVDGTISAPRDENGNISIVRSGGD